ncbi:MAG: hypothetical protein LBT66_04375 [Methanobrevibacter sp.]|jgi:hypothetical protein|nr:hypothetical protein [Candidatus Methanovirga meridionalis]
MSDKEKPRTGLIQSKEVRKGYPELKKESFEAEVQELRKKEIKKILELQSMGKKLTGWSNWNRNQTGPKDRFNVSLLTEEDILRYAPHSVAALCIRERRGEVDMRRLHKSNNWPKFWIEYHKDHLEYDDKWCYIATSVYGSYDSPEVRILRKFRDQKLKKTLIGRSFIKIYYAISPTIVKHFGNRKIFKHIIKRILDKIIVKLQE